MHLDFEPDTETGEVASPPPASSKRWRGGVLKRAASRLVEPLPMGPRTFDESCKWARDSVARCLANFPFSKDLAQAHLQRQVLVTSDYSGLGTAEIALSALLEALRFHGVCPEE
eukprot:190545-Alexandrium_andersonii.AAC.3